MPVALLVSPFYVLAVRRKITTPWLQTRRRWQLTTCIMLAAAIPVGFLLLFTGFAGWNADSPISIAATFLLVGISSLFPIWLIYRFLRGTLTYSRGRPMEGRLWS